MKQTNARHIRDLLERIVRINAAGEWSDDLSPTQLSVLSYLVQANRFSRAPSQVAEFMATTRGTISQTLKVLARKGLIEKIPSQTDRRWASYQVTNVGLQALANAGGLEDVLNGLDCQTSDALTTGLETLIRHALAARGYRPFGICKACRHFKQKKSGGFCSLLREELSSQDANQICHEYNEVA